MMKAYNRMCYKKEENLTQLNNWIQLIEQNLNNVTKLNLVTFIINY